MTTQMLSIPVDETAARIYREAAPEERRKIEVMLSLNLTNWAKRSKQDFFDTMDRISEEAERRGMTPEILESILRDE